MKSEERSTVGSGVVPPQPVYNLLFTNGLSVVHTMTEGQVQIYEGRFALDDCFSKFAAIRTDEVRVLRDGVKPCNGIFTFSKGFLGCWTSMSSTVSPGGGAVDGGGASTTAMSTVCRSVAPEVTLTAHTSSAGGGVPSSSGVGS